MPPDLDYSLYRASTVIYLQCMHPRDNAIASILDFCDCRKTITYRLCGQVYDKCRKQEALSRRRSTVEARISPQGRALLEMVLWKTSKMLSSRSEDEICANARKHLRQMFERLSKPHLFVQEQQATYNQRMFHDARLNSLSTSKIAEHVRTICCMDDHKTKSTVLIISVVLSILLEMSIEQMVEPRTKAGFPKAATISAPIAPCLVSGRAEGGDSRSYSRTQTCNSKNFEMLTSDLQKVHLCIVVIIGLFTQWEQGYL